MNEGRPEWLRRNAWDVGQVPEATDSFVQSMVNRVDRDGLRVEIGNSSSRPSIRRTSEEGQTLLQPIIGLTH